MTLAVSITKLSDDGISVSIFFLKIKNDTQFRLYILKLTLNPFGISVSISLSDLRWGAISSISVTIFLVLSFQNFVDGVRS